MTIKVRPGNAIGCIVNSHRDGWRGQICDSASTWNCGAEPSFREDFCASGQTYCFHLNLFAESDPVFLADWSGMDWILEHDHHALDDQILLFWGRKTAEPHGCDTPITRSSDYVFGAYRIKTCERMTTGRRTDQWRVIPHENGWTRFHQLKVENPPQQYIGGRYVRSVERSTLVSVFNQIAERAESPKANWFVPEDEQRFTHFNANLMDWLEIAETSMRATIQRHPKPIERTTVWTAGKTSNTPLQTIGDIVKTVAPPSQGAPTTTSTVQESKVILPRPAPHMIEAKPLAWVRDNYSDDLVTSLSIAAITKPLLILRGRPGAGKSHLAIRLLDDERVVSGKKERTRTHVVSVSSTWRGRENLFGYVNPVSGEFEPTPFTEFLIDCERVWKNGDKSARNVVFEEFNLSQPEHWLSDILVVSQYEEEGDRMIELGGRSIRGRPGSLTKIWLSPAIRFIATINSDHTTRPLSPRVLDRAAVIDLDLSPTEAIERIGLVVEDEMLDAITRLDHLLRTKGAGFSLRSAQSVKIAWTALSDLGLSHWRALDLVLCQELLSKVRLMARDPLDANVMQKLRDWDSQFGSKLPASSNKIDQWDEWIGAGLDVVQT